VAYCSELVYLAYFLRQFPLLQWYRHDVDMANITGHSHWGMIGFISATVELFALFGLLQRQHTHTVVVDSGERKLLAQKSRMLTSGLMPSRK